MKALKEENLINLTEALLENQLTYHKNQNSSQIASVILYRRLVSNAIGLCSNGNYDDKNLSIDEKNSQSKRNSILQFINPIRNGKFINIVSYKELKRRAHKMLEKPTGHLAFFHYLFNFSLILLSILFSAFTTIKTVKASSECLLFYIEIFVITHFFLEYCLRVWSCDALQQYKGFNGKIRFMLKPIMIIELLVFMFGSILIILSASNKKYFNMQQNKITHFSPIVFSLLSLLQLVRLLYVDRKASTWSILHDVCHKHKFELLSSVYIGFITMLLSSYLIYFCEKSVPDTLFRTYSDAVYWSIITMTTIGYGDLSPKTFYGKIIATGLCVLGVGFWTLPGGIIGSGFAFKIEERNKIKKFNRLVPASANLIQSWWRMRVAFDVPSEDLNPLISILKAFRPTFTNEESASKNKNLKLPRSILENQNLFNDVSANDKTREEKNLDFLLNKFDSKMLILTRTILVLKYFASRNKFKFAHKPYDFKDALEQYTKGNMDILSKIKELQRRIEQLSNISNSHHHSNAFEKKLTRHNTISSKTHGTNLSVENRMHALEKKIDLIVHLHLNERNRCVDSLIK